MDRSVARPACRRWRLSLAPGSLALMAGVAALVVLHAILLWRRLANPEPLELWAIGRWAGALLLVAFGRALQRRGLSLVRGRSAAVLWLLILLLHAQTPALAVAGGEAFLAPVAETAVHAVSWELLFLAVVSVLAAGAAGPRVRPGLVRGKVRGPRGRARRTHLPLALFGRPPPPLFDR